LIPRESDGDIYQDACPRGGGGFSSDLDFWWTILWLTEIYSRTQLPSSDQCFLSNNLLEYVAVILGLAGAIVAWESLPVETRPEHPLYLFWTDNMTAKAWTTKISGIKTPQGHSLARLFAHLLMFSDIGVDANHIEGMKNVVADFLSRLAETHDFSSFTYSQLQTRVPLLKLSRCFAPSSELLALAFSALLKLSVNIPTTRIKLGHMITESPLRNRISSVYRVNRPVLSGTISGRNVQNLRHVCGLSGDGSYSPLQNDQIRHCQKIRSGRSCASSETA
jgi:hypothetical protein